VLKNVMPASLRTMPDDASAETKKQLPITRKLLYFCVTELAGILLEIP
jgi:hypothetical protein